MNFRIIQDWNGLAIAFDVDDLSHSPASATPGDDLGECKNCEHEAQQKREKI